MLQRMKTKLFKFFFLFIILFIQALLNAESMQPFKLDEILDKKYVVELRAKGNVQFIHDEKTEELQLLPASKYAENFRNGKIKKEKDNLGFITESLYLVDKKTIVENSTSGIKPVDTSMNAVSRILRSVSKMQGMTYFSNLNNKVQILYNKTYMFASPDNTNPIPDQNTGNANGQISYCYQHDHTFGGCNYKLNYYQSANEMAAIFNNISWMMFGPFKAVKPGQMRINIIVMDCGNQYLMYMATDTNCIRLSIIENQLNDSFSARIDALYAWFIKQF
jgi:hypothetical protein